jgi:hypothetical protein
MDKQLFIVAARLKHDLLRMQRDVTAEVARQHRWLNEPLGDAARPSRARWFNSIFHRPDLAGRRQS